MSDEWCTPAWLIEKARAVLGGIELDPASNEEAQKIVKADRWFSKADDGLGREWVADSVWLNPPYSNTAAWVGKFLWEYGQRRVGQGLLLVNNNTETRWFQLLLTTALRCVFFEGRIKFYRPDQVDKPSYPRQGQVLFYFPSFRAHVRRSHLFSDVFRDCGTVWH